MPSWLAVLCLLLAGAAWADSWPMWCGTPGRNMVSPETGLPDALDPGRRDPITGDLDAWATPGVRWTARLGTGSYAAPTIAGGRVYIGCNNGRPRDPRYTGDRRVLLCLNAATGALEWMLNTERSSKGGLDCEGVGNVASPTVEGDRVYLVTNRAEVFCLDADGLADGNDGPFTDELRFVRGRRPGDALAPTDADVIWYLDLVTAVQAYPHDSANSAVLILGDFLVVATSNGMNDNMFKPDRLGPNATAPSPEAPSLVVLEKATGRLVAVDDAMIGRRVTHGQWSSPAYGVADGRPLIVYGGGDGICYAFDPTPGEPDAAGLRHLRTVWQYDLNPTAKRAMPVAWHSPDGRNEIHATPVLVGDRVFLACGQDPEHGPGVWGRLVCIDARGTGDISQTGTVWSYEGIRRSISTVAVADGLVYAADVAGVAHCLDAATGTPCWTFDTGHEIWAAPLVADGKVYLGNFRGRFLILRAGRTLEVLHDVRLPGRIVNSAVAADGVLYVNAFTDLYAFGRR